MCQQDESWSNDKLGREMPVSSASENQIAKDNSIVVGLVMRGKDER